MQSAAIGAAVQHKMGHFWPPRMHTQSSGWSGILRPNMDCWSSAWVFGQERPTNYRYNQLGAANSPQLDEVLTPLWHLSP